MSATSRAEMERRRDVIEARIVTLGDAKAAINVLLREARAEYAIIAGILHPRMGATLSCGCWTFKVSPGQDVGNVAECGEHGNRRIVQCNVPDPAVEVLT